MTSNIIMLIASIIFIDKQTNNYSNDPMDQFKMEIKHTSIISRFTLDGA